MVETNWRSISYITDQLLAVSQHYSNEAYPLVRKTTDELVPNTKPSSSNPEFALTHSTRCSAQSIGRTPFANRPILPTAHAVFLFESLRSISPSLQSPFNLARSYDLRANHHLHGCRNMLDLGPSAQAIRDSINRAMVHNIQQMIFERQ